MHQWKRQKWSAVAIAALLGVGCGPNGADDRGRARSIASAGMRRARCVNYGMSGRIQRQVSVFCSDLTELDQASAADPTAIQSRSWYVAVQPFEEQGVSMALRSRWGQRPAPIERGRRLCLDDEGYEHDGVAAPCQPSRDEHGQPWALYEAPVHGGAQPYEVMFERRGQPDGSCVLIAETPQIAGGMILGVVGEQSGQQPAGIIGLAGEPSPERAEVQDPRSANVYAVTDGIHPNDAGQLKLRLDGRIPVGEQVPIFGGNRELLQVSACNFVYNHSSVATPLMPETPLASRLGPPLEQRTLQDDCALHDAVAGNNADWPWLEPVERASEGDVVAVLGYCGAYAQIEAGEGLRFVAVDCLAP